MATVTRAPKRRKPAHGVCRLTLTINGTSYNVRPIRSDRASPSRRSASRRAMGRITMSPYHPWPHCDCPDFVLGRDGLDPEGCKHVKAMVACGLLDRNGGAK